LRLLRSASQSGPKAAGDAHLDARSHHCLNPGMPSTHLALLRGINVGGHHKVPIVELRALFEQLAYTDVATYVQSGNVLFTSETADEPTTVRGIATALRNRFGSDIPVVVRSTEELAAVAARHPYAAAQLDDAKLHVFFLAEDPAIEAIASLDAALFAPDEFTLDGRHLCTRTTPTAPSARS